MAHKISILDLMILPLGRVRIILCQQHIILMDSSIDFPFCTW